MYWSTVTISTNDILVLRAEPKGLGDSKEKSLRGGSEVQGTTESVRLPGLWTAARQSRFRDDSEVTRRSDPYPPPKTLALKRLQGMFWNIMGCPVTSIKTYKVEVPADGKTDFMKNLLKNSSYPNVVKQQQCQHNHLLFSV
ncbi:hypothetical protein B0H10DRAFT_1942959 [Mycena sp. CBHHK59/15]|nr:hypothetical protein B0H10DRAFT_1942959 [Mycena sp. CBHHK59/15]